LKSPFTQSTSLKAPGNNQLGPGQYNSEKIPTTNILQFEGRLI